MASLQLAVQLYTVRDQLDTDFAGTLHRLREAGYAYVELAGFHGRTADEVQRELDRAGLAARCGHFTIERLRDGITQVIDEARTLNLEYVVCPFLDESWRQDIAGWQRAANLLNEAGHTLAQHELQLCYHNHSFEFEPCEGRIPFDLLWATTDSAYVQAELDVYWVQHGGRDPVATIHQLRNRCPLLHLKDMADNPDRAFAVVGSGILSFATILKAATEAGTVWGIVEQDVCPSDPIECTRQSLAHVQHLLTSLGQAP